MDWAVRTTAAGGSPGSQRAVSPMKPRLSAPVTGRDSAGVFVADDDGGGGGIAEAAWGGAPCRFPVSISAAAMTAATTNTATAAPASTNGARPKRGLAGVGATGG